MSSYCSEEQEVRGIRSFWFEDSLLEPLTHEAFISNYTLPEVFMEVEHGP